MDEDAAVGRAKGKISQRRGEIFQEICLENDLTPQRLKALPDVSLAKLVAEKVTGDFSLEQVRHALMQWEPNHV